jgi:hypothetical protein
MAKRTRSTRPPVNRSTPSRSWDEILIDMTSRFGLSGVAILCLLYCFMAWGSPDQHREFIDRFILLKFSNKDTIFPFYIILLLIIIIIGTIVYFKKRLAIKEERIAYLEKDNDFLHSKLMERV